MTHRSGRLSHDLPQSLIFRRVTCRHACCTLYTCTYIYTLPVSHIHIHSPVTYIITGKCEVNRAHNTYKKHANMKNFRYSLYEIMLEWLEPKSIILPLTIYRLCFIPVKILWLKPRLVLTYCTQQVMSNIWRKETKSDNVSQIGKDKRYPIVHYFGIPRHTKSMIAYANIDWVFLGIPINIAMRECIYHALLFSVL